MISSKNNKTTIHPISLSNFKNDRNVSKRHTKSKTRSLMNRVKPYKLASSARRPLAFMTATQILAILN